MAVQATHDDLAFLRDVAATAADRAAAVIRAAAATAVTLEWRAKSVRDFVSEVDTAAEHEIREAIVRAIPDAQIMGEELSPTTAIDTGVAFVVDPLDGTVNFLHGYAPYAVSIAVLLDGVPAVGIVEDVPRGQRFIAVAGEGATRDGTTIRASTVRDARRALIGTGFPFKNPELLDDYLRQFAVVTRATAGIRRAGSAAVDLADVACGRFDAFWELWLSPWDFAAGALLVREAGGTITDLEGGQLGLRPSAVVAGNAVLQPWLLDVVRANTGRRPA